MFPSRIASSCGPSSRPGTDTAMTFVANTATLRDFRRARDADEESAASSIGRPIVRVAPAIATRGGEFKFRRLILILLLVCCCVLNFGFVMK